MLKAIIMDFDGLIVDTEVVWYQIYKEWFASKKNYVLSVEEFLTCVGASAESLFCALDAQGCHVDRASFVQDTQARFIEESCKLPAKEGVADFIRAAKQAGLLLALATSSSRLKPETHLTRLGLLPYFDTLVTAEEVARIKPFPDLFLKAADKLHVTPAESLVIEDSLNGLVAGKNADMRVLVVPNEVTRHCVFEGYYRKVDSLAQVEPQALITDF